MTRTTLPFARILDLTIVRATPAGDSLEQVPYRTPAESAAAQDRSALKDDEKDSVIEVAMLMATANGDTSPDELASLADLVAHLLGNRPASGQLTTWMTAIEKRGLGGSAEERVRAIATTLKRPLARELAYKAAYAIRVSDLEANPDEEDLGDILVEALELGELVADLESEVNEALIVD